MTTATLQVSVHHPRCGHDTVVEVPRTQHAGATLALVCAGCGELFEAPVPERPAAAPAGGGRANGGASGNGAPRAHGRNGQVAGRNGRRTRPAAKGGARRRGLLAGAAILLAATAGGGIVLLLAGGGAKQASAPRTVKQWEEAAPPGGSSDAVYVPKPAVGDSTRYIFRRFRFEVPRGWRVSSGRVPVRVSSKGGVSASIWWRRQAGLEQLVGVARRHIRAGYPNAAIGPSRGASVGGAPARIVEARYGSGAYGTKERVTLLAKGAWGYYFSVRVPDPAPEQLLLGARLLERSFALR